MTGRPPRPAFRFTDGEVAKMEKHLRNLNAMPQRPVIQDLTDEFNASSHRSGKIPVQYKQVRTWFQNRRYKKNLRGERPPAQGKMLPTGAEAQHPASYRVQSSCPSNSGNTSSDGGLVHLEAKSPRNGAWYDVAAIQSCRFSITGDQEVQVWFSGFGAEEEEWINVCKSVRLRSLPCTATECVDVLPGDLILCYQEGNEQALYFDAHVLEVERCTHDIRGCRCSFLVRYDHDNSEEIVPLRKVCRRPSADVKIDIVIDHSLAEQKAQKPHKMMDLNPDEVTVVASPPDQGGPSDNLDAPLLITPDSTHRDSFADVQMGDIEAASGPYWRNTDICASLHYCCERVLACPAAGHVLTSVRGFRYLSACGHGHRRYPRLCRHTAAPSSPPTPFE